ncbi:MAG TPA: RDD family protein [Ktedonobacterales bacterium]|jgi:uncharacterized RDD family membrane protein YckC
MKNSLALFWKRLLAFALDYIIISAYLVLLVIVGVVVARTSAGPGFRALFDDPNSAEATAFLLLVAPVLLYFAIFESSRWQATWGKRVLGLRAMTTSGKRAGFLRALWRNALKLLPWELTHACLWRIPGWPFDPQTPPLWINMGLILVWVIVAVYVISLLVSRTGQTLYDHLAGMRIALAESIAEPHDRRIK